MSHNRKQHGFVLILVLVVLAIAGTVLGVSAYRCGQQVLRAAQGRQALQDTWADLCIRGVVLPQVGEILAVEAEENANELAPARLVQPLTLGGNEYTLVLADEQAKASVNTLVYMYGEDAASRIESLAPEAEMAVESLAGYPSVDDAGTAADVADGSQDVPTTQQAPEGESPQTQPAGGQSGPAMKIPVLFVSPDAFLAYDSPTQLINVEDASGPLDRLTFWGDGRLNFYRADKDTITQVTASLLSSNDVQRLIGYREEFPGGSLADLMGVLALDDRTVGRVRALLTDRSNCRSVWVLRRSPTGNHTTLLIEQDKGTKDGRSVRRLAW